VFAWPSTLPFGGGLVRIVQPEASAQSATSPTGMAQGGVVRAPRAVPAHAMRAMAPLPLAYRGQAGQAQGQAAAPRPTATDTGTLPPAAMLGVMPPPGAYARGGETRDTRPAPPPPPPPAANALVGEGRKPGGGYRREVVITPAALAGGGVFQARRPTPAALPPGSVVVPVHETGPARAALDRLVPDLPPAPAPDSGPGGATVPSPPPLRRAPAASGLHRKETPAPRRPAAKGKGS
jgi:hypothetical protein